ncbi:MAG: tRNA dihydrouridine synthase DusB [Holosporaceae bacterium]|jgi:tRNA-dihydrouridine synthase B|nr:tRNA dihydrouridine synthase DusB [Holosporaceae bacterium]
MQLDKLFHESPVFLAPMAGITDAPFRHLVCSFGASAVVSEMVSSEALVRNSLKTQRRLIADNALKIVQIVGANPHHMTESARINESLGADVLDINMGCPARKIVSNESGAALMKNEDLAVEIVAAIVNAVKIPVTVKMRLGWDAEHINYCSLAKKFEDVGVKMLTVHCRTRNQMYSGKADWSAIASLRNNVKIPYLCNGDIKTPENAIKSMELSGAYGIMIGRATLGRPWLLRQIMNFIQGEKIISTPSLEEQFNIVMQHFYDTLNFYGELHGVRVFRKHFCWYSSGLEGASKFREIINKSENISFIKDRVRELYEGGFIVKL